MKGIALTTLVLSMKLAAQDVIINPPISVDSEAGRVMVQDRKETPAATSGSAVEIKGKAEAKKNDKKTSEQKSDLFKNQVDNDYTTDADTNSVHHEQLKAPIAESADDFDPSEIYEKYIQFSSGYINSKWNKISPTLSNGSTTTEFKMAADMNRRNQVGFSAMQILQKGGDTSAENVRVMQYKFFWEYHRGIWNERLNWFTGLALSSGDFAVFTKTTVNGAETYTKIKSGSILGVIPTLGFKLFVVGKNSLDVAVEYHYYFAKPQRYIGGVALAPRFSFVF